MHIYMYVEREKERWHRVEVSNLIDITISQRCLFI